jgi:hypothetical protein
MDVGNPEVTVPSFDYDRAFYKTDSRQLPILKTVGQLSELRELKTSGRRREPFQAAKAALHFEGARLKSCPFKTATVFSTRKSGATYNKTKLPHDPFVGAFALLSRYEVSCRR